MKKTSGLEHDNQSEMIVFLTSLKDSFFYRQNTGAFEIENRFIRFSIPGASDIIGGLQGRLVAVEAKRTKNGRQGIDQKRYQRNIERCGGVYILASHIDILKKEIKRHGFDDQP